MITAITSKNNDKYRQLFEAASEILSGFQSVRTYDKDYIDGVTNNDPGHENSGKYFYKSEGKDYIEVRLENKKEDGEYDENTSPEDKLYNFALALEQYGKIYKWVGQPEDAKGAFSPKLGITSLEEYYNWLPVLKKEVVGGEEKPTIFTKLPLDEPHFKINPNRSISIPDDFKKNGIGVQGDDLAEVVYFEIDRYQDSIDLNNCDIYIEWETPKGKDNTLTKAVSKPYLKILSNDENYNKMVFGWAVSEAITKNSGSLKFAVRFIQVDSENKIVYSFNTLTAQVTIHPNLGIGMAEAIKNPENNDYRLLERIKESEIVGGAIAAIPYFLIDLKNIEEDKVEYDILNSEGEKDHENGQYKLYVAATAEDTGMVKCSWKKNLLNENNVPYDKDKWEDILDKDLFGQELVEVTLEELAELNYKLIEDHMYYYSNGSTVSKVNYDLLNEDVQGYIESKLAYIQTIQLENGKYIPRIYEHKDYLIVSEAGRYKAVAKNRIFSSVRIKDSKIATFKRPDHIKINEGNPIKHLITKNEGYAEFTKPIKVTHDNGEGKHYYKWLKRDENVDSKISATHALDPQLDGAEIKYGVDRIRVCYPKAIQKEFKNQNPNEELGGSQAEYYLRLKTYAPEGAVKFRRGSKSLYNKENKEYYTFDDVELKEEIRELANQEHTGSANGVAFRDDYLSVATKPADSDIYIYKGTDSYYPGYIIKYEWLNAQEEVIGTSRVIVEIATELNYEENLDNYFTYSAIEGATSPEFTITENTVPGYYKLEVTRIRNRATTTQYSGEYRITKEPISPEWSSNTFTSQQGYSLDQLKNGKAFEYAWNKPLSEADGYQIIWYQKLIDEEPIVVLTKQINDGTVLSDKFNPWIEAREVLGEIEDNYDGFYYAVIRTRLNGVLSDKDEDNELKDVSSTNTGVMFAVSVK